MFQDARSACRDVRRTSPGARLGKLSRLRFRLAVAALTAILVPFAPPFDLASNGTAEAKRGKRVTSIEARLERARARKIIKNRQAKAARRKRQSPSAIPSPATEAGVAAAGAEADGKKLSFADMRAAVLAAPKEDLVRVGRHLIVGYHNAAQLTPLLEHGAIGGIFVTARNARGRTKARLAAEIAELRNLAAKGGQTPFWITTDQEGGSVSRLSPPLPRQPSLGRLLAELKTPEARVTAVASFAGRQAEALADIGVNINFAPVADLNLDVRSARDRFTRLRHRAVSSDPLLVAEAARVYCENLLARSVACTLKHFPGLGRVVADTHLVPATLKTPREVLDTVDWVPFRHVVEATPAVIMMGHAHLASVDTEIRPASTSQAVIEGVVRKSFGFNGVVITDDLAMGAIRKRKGGMTSAAVDALDAGADLILVGIDGDQIYDVLYAMLEAVRSERISKDKLKRSEMRLLALSGATALASSIARNAEAQKSPALDAASSHLTKSASQP